MNLGDEELIFDHFGSFVIDSCYGGDQERVRHRPPARAPR